MLLKILFRDFRKKSRYFDAGIKDHMHSDIVPALVKTWEFLPLIEMVHNDIDWMETRYRFRYGGKTFEDCNMVIRFGSKKELEDALDTHLNFFIQQCLECDYDFCEHYKDYSHLLVGKEVTNLRK